MVIVSFVEHFCKMLKIATCSVNSLQLSPRRRLMGECSRCCHGRFGDLSFFATVQPQGELFWGVTQKAFLTRWAFSSFCLHVPVSE